MDRLDPLPIENFPPFIAGMTLLLLAAIAGIAFCGLPGWLKLTLLLLAAVGIWREGRRWLQEQPRSLCWSATGHCQLLTRDGRWLAAALQPDSVITGECLALCWRAEDGAILRQLLLPGMTDADTLRRLRAGLLAMRQASV